MSSGYFGGGRATQDGRAGGTCVSCWPPRGRCWPASTLKVLTAISLIPLLNPNAMVLASKQATTVSPNIVGLLATYRGALGGKIGWTSAAGATYVGMARRHGVTLIVTLLHCPALTEIDAGKSLLNWGFAVDGKVRPVGTLVAARQPPAPSPARSAPEGNRLRTARPATRAQSVGSGPSVLVAAGFSGVVLLAAVIGVFYSRRQRPRT